MRRTDRAVQPPPGPTLSCPAQSRFWVPSPVVAAEPSWLPSRGLARSKIGMRVMPIRVAGAVVAVAPVPVLLAEHEGDDEQRRGRPGQPVA
jgi:hypothetical protein